MRSHPLTLGRTFGLVFEHGEEFMATLSKFCAENGVRQGYIPGFLGAFASVDLVGHCEAPPDPMAPGWGRLHLEYVEAVGFGTIATDLETGGISPHVHVATGIRRIAGAGHTSHLYDGTVQFLTELLVVEVLEPVLHRRLNPDLYDLHLLHFSS